jgi:hypothetical protein
MHRAIPSVNKILSKKQRENDDKKLCKKLDEIKFSKSSYNFRMKSQPKISKRNAFFDQIRDNEIRRENQHLAKKIRNIVNEYSIKKDRPSIVQSSRKNCLPSCSVYNLPSGNSNLLL